MITVFTVVFKLLLMVPGMVGAGDVVLKALNLVLSFLVIQAAGFRLATKQSALFGSVLGFRRRSLRRRPEVRHVLRSQALSAAGNLAMVGAGGVLFHLLFNLFTGSPLLDEPSADAALRSLHPWRSNTLVYAALTGIILWLCSFVGTWIAHRFRPRSKAAVSVCFNILLGTTLAMVPTVGHWLEIPLDVRHFTLSGGSAVIAAASLGPAKAVASGLLPALAGVVSIGVLNFGVSFALAFLGGIALSPRERMT